ncbi:FGGY-family carbohydrate kinase [Planctomycetota bacterium]
MKSQTIAVLDVGKTNKKVLIYDLDLNLLDMTTASFPEIDQLNLKLEQPEAVFDWFCEVLAEFSAQYQIKVISVTTHGATIVCIDNQGGITVPPLSYTNTAAEGFAQEFFDTFGSRESLQQSTATAEIGDLINAGKMVYFLKKNFSKEMEQTEWILHYPQYFGFKLTGVAGAEPTMLGSHSYLFDPLTKDYSPVAHKLGIMDKLPPTIHNSWQSLGTITEAIATRTGIDKDCQVTFGVHDSNSSLIPYLIRSPQKFVLNSTGTWCVAISPEETIHFSPDELGKLVFYNMDIFKNPAKTSIFMGGLEYETYFELFCKINDRKELPDFDYDLYKSVADACSDFILPSVTKGTGIFPDSSPRLVEGDTVVGLEAFQSSQATVDFVHDFEKACAILIYSLAIQTAQAFKYVGIENGAAIFVEGGFRHNQPYLTLLKQFYPESDVFTTDLKQATAIGAAICGLALLEGKSPNELTNCVDIKAEKIDIAAKLDVKPYMQKFVQLVQNT